MKCTALCIGFFAAISVVQGAGEVEVRDLDFMVPRECGADSVDNNLLRRGNPWPKPSGKPKPHHDHDHGKGGHKNEKGGHDNDKGWHDNDKGWHEPGNSGKDKGKGEEDCDDDKKAYSYQSNNKGKPWWKRDAGDEVEKRDLKQEQLILEEVEDTATHAVYSKTVVVLVPTYSRHIKGPTKIKDGTGTLTFASPTVFTFTNGPYTRTKQVLSCHTTTTEYDIEEGCPECTGWPYRNRK